mgnify:CR=1 FL=1
MAKITSIKPEEYGSYQWLLRETGKSLGLNPSPATWPHDQTQRVDSIVQSGVMQFYFCSPTQNANDEDGAETDRDARLRQPHIWSFLNQLGTFDLTAGESTYELPEDFAGVSGDLVLQNGKGRIPVVAETHLRQIAVKDAASGDPQYAAVRPKIMKGGRHQAWEVVLYPTPSESASLNYRYTVAAANLSDERPFPLGGVAHAETALASCLAVAEDRESPSETKARQLYGQRLLASVHLDKRVAKPAVETIWDADAVDNESKLRGLVGLHMGYGQNKNAWDETARQMVEEAMRQGKQRFYVPPPIPGRRTSHKWSFLTPVGTLNIESGKFAYDLPKDFGGVDSPITYAPGQNVIYPPIDVIGEHHIRRLQQASTQADGRPTRAGIRQKEGVQESGTQYEILLWPVPDGSYELQYKYRVTPDQNTGVVHGGDAHFQTILEAMKAAADSLMNRKQRPHEQAFLQRLIASVMLDEQLNAPKQMGYNRDGSNRLGYDIFDDNHRFGYGDNAVGYNGINY